MDDLVRYGMVGGGVNGFIGEVHRKAVAFDPRAALVSGCFSNIPEENLATAEAYHIADGRRYSDYKEMAQKEAARGDGIDFVSITTPNNWHYEMAKEFLSHGINVVCEKPLCFEIEQAEELVNLARSKNLLFGVTYSYTGYTMVKIAKEMIAKNKIGDVISVSAEFSQGWLLNSISKGGGEHGNLSIWRADPKAAGISNCVGDIGAHVENLVHYMTGLSIKRLLATTDRFGQALDLNANILVEYTNGAKGAYWCSQVAAGRENGLAVRIYGTEGSLEWDQHFPDQLKYSPKNEPTRILSRGCDYLKDEAAAYSRLPFGHPEGLHVAFANLYQDYISALIQKKNGAEPILNFPDVTDGLTGVRFIHAVVKSASEDSAWVTL